MAAEPKERDPVAVAFGVVVERRLAAMGRGAKSRLGRHLGATDYPTGSSRVHTLLKEQKNLAPQYGVVAEFLGMKRSELLQEIVDYLREQGL